ncbi:MAG: velvet factor-domain-containing protein [Linnemannia gamsii]|nr:MAG: velvet factor-domain-containing protein [Linnemannia gamsii]
MVKSASTAYCFVSGKTEKSQAADSSKYLLVIRQQPQRAKVCGNKERDRRSIDPPPIVQIKLADASTDKNKDYLQSPYLFMCCNVVHADDPNGDIVAPAHRALAGTVVSSLNRLKDVDNSDGGFFVFGDISVRIEGRFCLRFTLFELIEGQVVHVMTSISNAMTVHSSKTFPGMLESTFLSRSFSDQGVRIRIRKDHHVKPKHAVSDDTSEGGATHMHSPPSSCHEAEHSDHDDHQPAKRSRPSPTAAFADSPYAQASSRHVPIAARPKVEPRFASSESIDRTPPSSPRFSPRSFHAQDASPSRPRHHPYSAEEESRYYEEYGPSRHPPHGCYSSSQPSYYDGHPYYRHYPQEHPYAHPQARYHDGPREIPYSHEHHRHHSSSAGPTLHYPSHEHSHPHEGSSSYGYAPSYPMGTSHHPSASSVYTSRPEASHYHHHQQQQQQQHSQSTHAGRHGFPAALLNDQEMGYAPAQATATVRRHHDEEPYHSRTPSMSSQHSDGNFSPPLPFSPVDPRQVQDGRSHSPPHMSLPSLSRVPVNEKVQLPSIHTLSSQLSTASVHGDQHRRDYY